MTDKPIQIPGEKLDRERITIVTLRRMKAEGQKLSALSIYDFPFARLADQAGLHMIIVGDSLGMTMLGYKNTLPVTMDEMIIFASAARRGTDRVFIVGDMPFSSYQASDSDGVRNAARFIKEAGCEAVKCEASKKLISRIKAIADAEILVMGHIGLNPQKIHEMGGYRIQGKTLESTVELLEMALRLQDAGVFALLLEGVTEEVASVIHDHLEIPVYGIGSGRIVDGQLLIGHDPLGLYSGFKKQPAYIKQYRPDASNKTVGELMLDVFSQYVSEVSAGIFPGPEHVHHVKDVDLESIATMLRERGFRSLPSQPKNGSTVFAKR